METMNAVDREHSEREVITAEDHHVGWRHWGLPILLLALVAAAPSVLLTAGYAGFVIIYTIASGAWLLLVLRNHRSLRALRPALLIGVTLRLAVFFTPPALSEDVYRYLWDGRVLVSGTNPYRYAPADPRLAALRQPWHGRINHPELRTIYPPHAEILFAAFHELTLWRLLLLACDLMIIWRLPPRFRLAYAAMPLVMFEGVWSGHIEIVAALLLLVTSSWAVAVAAGLKVIPLIAAPALLRRNRRDWLLFAAVLMGPAIPFLLDGPFMSGFHDYALRWVFNSPLYAALFPLAGHLSPHVKDLWSSIKDPLHLESVSGVVYRHVYGDFLTRAAMGTIAVIGLTLRLLRGRREGDSCAIAADCIGILLLCSPAIHPWYWLSLIPLLLIGSSSAPEEGRTASPSRTVFWTSIALCAPFSYLLYASAAPALVFALCYALPVAVSIIWRLQTSATAT